VIVSNRDFPDPVWCTCDDVGLAGRGRPKAELVLTGEERETLERWTRRRTSSQQLALRSRIVLACACADGASYAAVAERLGVSRLTVGKWRSRFVQRRLQGLVDEPRSGAPRTATDEQVEQVIIDTLEKTPKDATHWSRASMARHAGLSPSTVGRIWKAFRLKPHLSETFKLSTDPFAFVLNLDRSMVACGAPYVDPMRMGVLAVTVGPAQTR
jgi:transposase